MDKYEFDTRVEKMLNRKSDKNYTMAAEIADKINWKEVYDAPLLIDVAEIYKNIGEYDRAKEIYELAFETAAIPSRYIYDSCDICGTANTSKEETE